MVSRISEAYESGAASRAGSVARGGSEGGGGNPLFQGEGYSLRGGPPAAPAPAGAATPSAGRALGDMRGLTLAGAGDPLFVPPPAQQPPHRPPPMSAGALLAALPERAVAPNGALLGVRATVSAALGLPAAGGEGAAPPALTPSATPVTPDDPAAAHIKVRFDGAPMQTRVFLLHADEDTVGALLAVVAAQRAATGPFELRSAAAPRTAYTLRAPREQLQLSLRAVGFAPTASLFVRAVEAENA